MIYPNLFFSFLFYPILFCPYFIQSYPILSHSFLFYSILSYSILILFYPIQSSLYIQPYSILFYHVLSYSIPIYYPILCLSYHILYLSYPILIPDRTYSLHSAVTSCMSISTHIFRPDLTQLVLFYHSVSRRSHIKSVLLVLSHTCLFYPDLSTFPIPPIPSYPVLIKQFINKPILKE